MIHYNEHENHCNNDDIYTLKPREKELEFLIDNLQINHLPHNVIASWDYFTDSPETENVDVHLPGI